MGDTKTYYQVIKCGDGEGAQDEVIATVEGDFGDALALGREMARGKGITVRFARVTVEDVTPVATEGELQTVLPVPAIPSQVLIDEYEFLLAYSHTDARPGSSMWCKAQALAGEAKELATKHPELPRWFEYKKAQRWTAQQAQANREQAAGYRYQH